MIHIRGRTVRVWPRPLPARALAALALAGLALCLASCTGTSGHPATPSVGGGAPAPSPVPGNACADPSTRYEQACHAVSVSGKTFRYLLFRAAPATPDTTIYDRGGPGASSLSRIDADYEQVAADAHARGLNLLILDEPWVVAPYESACRSAMALFYRESTQRYPQPATSGTVASVHQSCLSTDAAATTNAEEYRSAIGQIEQAEKVSVVRLEGHSFASVRAAYLGLVRPDLVVAVSTPFPVGARATDFYAAVGAAAGNIQGAVTGRGVEADSALAYYATSGTPPKDLDQTTAARWLWQVTNAGDMSLSRVGYYSEVCAALTNWTALVGQPHQEGSAITALASMHAPCAAEEQPASLKLPTQTCFAVLSGDPNSPWVPSPLTREAHIDIVTVGEHGKVEIPRCD